MGSLLQESVEKLADEGLLSSVHDTQENTAGERALKGIEATEGRKIRGVPWFEEMIEGSELGRIRRRRGVQSSADGKSNVEWEVVEFTSEPGDTTGNTGKRKLDEVGKEGDVEMKG